MSDPVHTGIFCKMCGREKHTDNHWLAVLIRSGYKAATLGEIQDPNAFFVCGSECENKAHAEWSARFFGCRQMNSVPGKIDDAH